MFAFNDDVDYLLLADGSINRTLYSIVIEETSLRESHGNCQSLLSLAVDATSRRLAVFIATASQWLWQCAKRIRG